MTCASTVRTQHQASRRLTAPQRCPCSKCARQRNPAATALGNHTISQHLAESSALGPGEPLSLPMRASFETGLGIDLSGVRIHRRDRTASFAKKTNARAFAVGNHIGFGAGAYQPKTNRGMETLGHELIHVAQQQRVGSRNTSARAAEREADRLAPRLAHGDAVDVRQSAPVGLARQESTASPILTHSEMFEIIVRQRAWEFNEGGQLNPGQAERSGARRGQHIGRGAGPNAGGRRAGHAVFAVIQIVDRDNNVVLQSRGEYLRYGDPHAEQRAISALRQQIPQVRDLNGGRMMVVVDQIPCGANSANCMAAMRQYARENGLNLDVRVPTRERVNGGGSVTPRTATRDTQMVGRPATTLRHYDPGSQSGGSPPPGAGAPNGPSAAFRGSSGSPNEPTARASQATPRRPATTIPQVRSGQLAARPFVPRLPSVRPPSSAIAIQRSAAIGQLQGATLRSSQFATRVSVYSTAASGLLALPAAILSISDAQSMLANGTLLPGVERQADIVAEQAQSRLNWTTETTDQISLLNTVAVLSDALDRRDGETLMELSQQFGDFSDQAGPIAEDFGNLGTQLHQRARALNIAAEMYLDLAHVPTPGTTAGQAHALAMHQSLQRLSGRIRTSAERYSQAATTLRYYDNYLATYAYRANRASWNITWANIAESMTQFEAHQGEERRRQMTEQRQQEQLRLQATQRQASEQRRRDILARISELEGQAESIIVTEEGALDAQRERDELRVELSRIAPLRYPY